MKLNWGNYILIFIILFLTLCAIFIVFSLRQDNDLVTRDYYRQGAEFTTGMEIRERSTPYNDSILLNENDGLLLAITPFLAKNAGEMEIWFYRPSSMKDDYKISVDPGSSTINIDRSRLKRGRYILKVSWMIDSLQYSTSREVFIN